MTTDSRSPRGRTSPAYLLLTLLATATAIALAAACGNTVVASGTSCTPGLGQGCTPSTSCEGFGWQVCNAAGTAWSACGCAMDYGPGGGFGSSSSSVGGTGGGVATSTVSGGGAAGGGSAAGQCRTMSDCTGTMSSEECVPPGGFPGCGICFNPMPACTADADCASQGPDSICALPLCSCMGLMACVAGCTSSAACAVGETCASSHHCEPTACASDGDCPTNFGCTSSQCQRKTCTSDAACAGYCVEGSCYDALGTCTLPPA